MLVAKRPLQGNDRTSVNVAQMRRDADITAAQLVENAGKPGKCPEDSERHEDHNMADAHRA
jgi:hypothetical protein